MVRAPPRATCADRIAAARLDWIVPDWPAPCVVEAFVTTRNARGPANERIAFDPGGHLPCGDPGDADIVTESRQQLRRLLPSEPRWLDQIHGAQVLRLGRDERSIAGGEGAGTGASRADAPQLDVPRADVPRGDASVTSVADVVLAIRVADCLPVLFCNRSGTAIGAAHAGWRGLAGGILESTVEALDAAPGDVLAWIGPGIGRRAFEVGPEVREAFVTRDDAAADAFTPGRADRWHGDLEALARARLARAGVGGVYGGGMCTFSDPARFYSWRRERARGRMAALIWIAGNRAAPDPPSATSR